jgi:hypothetical protein
MDHSWRVGAGLQPDTLHSGPAGAVDLTT